jgi:hypothetical protein
MSQFIFKKGIRKNSNLIGVSLLLIYFKDENNVHFIYSPHLDLTGYGNNLSEAKASFEIVFDDFIDYTLKKKTIGKVLTKLGWQLKGSVKKPKNVIAPSITSIISENEYVSDIFDKYPTKTFHQEVGIPAMA